jgi:hypothetical protein
MPYLNQASLFRNPSAWVPLVMSAAALGLVLFNIATVSPEQRPADEETAAHVFQLLIAGQAPIAAFFALKWLPRSPGHALYVLAAQAAAALIALAPVAIFDL